MNIPVFCPMDEDGRPSRVSSQQIIQWKELEVDQVRYNEWKMSLAKAKKRARKQGRKKL